MAGMSLLWGEKSINFTLTQGKASLEAKLYFGCYLRSITQKANAGSLPDFWKQFLRLSMEKFDYYDGNNQEFKAVLLTDCLWKLLGLYTTY